MDLGLGRGRRRRRAGRGQGAVEETRPAAGRCGGRLPDRKGRTLEPRPHALTALGGLAALFARRRRTGSALAGLALTAGSLATRFAVFEAGIRSAADPQHVIAPQRERLARGERAHSEGGWLETKRTTAPVPRS
ncbi:hypothetical protein GCM10009559_22940 [Pseudonocardia zijingensis]|uniref:PEP-CTERM sorting domain-containing protein n=1 Tax=Pseudonocardia zijingensis TaxID=153376 RepID=A0ABP4ABK7_9PSEU